MKRLLTLLLISAITLGLFQSCTSNDSTNPINSNIKIDNRQYTPTALEVSNGEQADQYIKGFVLRQGDVNDPDFKQINLSISYPKTQANASGTYTFEMGNVGEHLYCQGSYFDNSTNYISWGMGAGNLIVMDKGNNNYDITFQNVQVSGMINTSHMDPSTNLNIMGNIHGTFKLMN